MKKIVSVFLAIIILCSLCACGNSLNITEKEETEVQTEKLENNSNVLEPETVGESINSLAERVYEPLVFNIGDDFLTFFSSINEEYSACIVTFSDYLVKHSTDIETYGKGFSDFEDYESSMERYYKFLYGVMYCESGNIPKEYQNAFSIYKTSVWINKSNLDELYNLKGQELIDNSSEMLAYIQASTNLINEAMPAAYKELKLGDTIQLDFVEMTIDGTGIMDKILPTDTSTVYSYIGDIENEQYYYINGTIKNLCGTNIDVKNIYIKFIFDNTYEYIGQMAACAYTNDFYGESVKPLGTVEYYIYASIPDELIEQYSQCEIMFGFNNKFSGNWFMREDDCEQLFKVALER